MPRGLNNEPLAVKIQYPGIAQTITSDVSLLKQMLRPLVQRDQLMPTLKEVAERLREEVDYRKEADHVAFFAGHLSVDGVRDPSVRPELSGPTVLSTTLLSGRPLDVWLNDNPGQKARDRIAQDIE